VNIGQIAKMAQQMQTQMAQAQEELKQTTLEATAGGGAVRIVITGAQEVRRSRSIRRPSIRPRRRCSRIS
jgi:DNA-binding protein YbaB